jgi:hypothetical protein
LGSSRPVTGLLYLFMQNEGSSSRFLWYPKVYDRIHKRPLLVHFLSQMNVVPEVAS